MKSTYSVLSKGKKTLLSWLGSVSKKRLSERLVRWRKSVRGASWRQSSTALVSRMKFVQNLFKRKDYANQDDFFFTIEDLPYLGKEYWFMHFVVPGSDEQVVITAGRSQEAVQVNRSKVRENAGSISGAESPGIADCAAVCWMYSGKKEVFIDSSGVVGLKKTNTGHRLFFRKGRNEMSIKGAYPDFDIELRSGNKPVFSVKASAKKVGDAWEMHRLLENPVVKGVGAVIVNYFFDFDGEIRGKRVRGKAYLQKVVATVPFAPWNWVRIEFKGGDAFDYFAGKPLGVDFGPMVHFLCNNYLELGGERHKINGMKLESFIEGENRRWVLSGEGIFLSMESYSLQPFSMKQKTRFQYDEYLVRVTDFYCRVGDRAYTLKDMGPGSGIIEDAYGYLI